MLIQDIEISVGIIAANKISFSLQGKWEPVDGKDVSGSILMAEATGTGGFRLLGKVYQEISFIPAAPETTFEIHDVVIGIDFHWERKETQRFEGKLKLVAEGRDKVRAINVINVDNYLKSVISSEMNGDSPLELLKAHAVISRSWLLAQIFNKSRHRKGHGKMVETDREIVKWFDREDHNGFDVCADDHCQRYQGVTRASNPRVAQAIDATRGKVLAYEGEICDTRFSKCCGGRSETFENCWGDDPHPYLVSIEDNFCNTRDKEVLATVLNSYDCETLDFHDWTVKYNADYLADMIRRKSGIDFGRIKALEPLKRGESGRITKLKIIGEKRTVTVGKELMIRRWLSESHLYSSDFEVTTEGTDHDGYPLSFTLSGQGWGHGVGLCQIGAAVMASEGYDYQAILKHYFPLSEIVGEI